MAFNDFSEFPRGRTQVTSLTNTAQSVFTGPGRVSGVVINGGANPEIVIFRANDDSPEYFRFDIAATSSVYIPVRFFAEEGLEVLTATAAGDVTVTVFYFEPSSPIG